MEKDDAEDDEEEGRGGGGRRRRKWERGREGWPGVTRRG